ncbi:MAG: hypothetical protein ACRDJW_22690 [Thermomicrobiales bacterium]
MGNKYDHANGRTRLIAPPERDDRSPDHAKAPTRLITDLGWTIDEAAETRNRLGAFADDWDDPTMDVYDDM